MHLEPGNQIPIPLKSTLQVRPYNEAVFGTVWWKMIPGIIKKNRKFIQLKGAKAQIKYYI